ncbi:MAG: hypothetical protein AAGA96_07995 [Verrucomicrobiota bacterium]
MKGSFEELSGRFREALTEFIWNQWVSIGVAGSVKKGSKIPFAIDPEALLLATTRFGMTEPRLAGEVLDWLTLNGKAIRLQRIKNLQVEYHLGNVRVMKSIAEILEGSGQKNWHALKGMRGSEDERDSRGGRRMIDLSEIGMRGMSQKPDPYSESAFLFRMRSFFGMNARAEIFTWLLTHEGGHAAAIARETGWFSKTVQVTLNELAQSGLITGLHDEGMRSRERVFRIDRDPWRFLTPLSGALRWFPQAPFYLGCRHILRTLNSVVADTASSSRMVALKIRENLAPTAVSFQRAGVGDLFDVEARFKGDHLVEAYQDGVEKILHRVTYPIEGVMPFQKGFRSVR